MSAASTRAILVYRAMRENVTECITGTPTPLSDSVLARVLDHAAAHPDASEGLHTILDAVRIAAGVLIDVLGHDQAHTYLDELLILCETAGILDDAAENEVTQ